MSFNKVVLVANLTRDPEVRYLQNGNAVVDISVAVNEKYKKGEELKEEVTFIDVTFFGRTAEVCGQYCVKGQQILIEGRLKQDRWEDKESGQKRSKLKVIGEALKLLGRGNGGGESRGGSQQSAGETSSETYEADDATPF